MRIGLASLLLFVFWITATRPVQAQICDAAHPEAPKGRSTITTTFAPSFGSFPIGGIDAFGGNAQTTLSFSNNRVEFRKQNFKCHNLDARCDNEGQGELVGYWEISDTTVEPLFLCAGFAAFALEQLQQGVQVYSSIHQLFGSQFFPCLLGPAVATPAASVGRTLTVFISGASREAELVVARRCASQLTQAACGDSAFTSVSDRGAGHTFGWTGYFVLPIPAPNPNGCAERLRANVFGSGEGDVMPEFTQCMEDELREWFATEAIDEDDDRVGDQCDIPSIEYPSGDPATAEASAQNEFVFPSTNAPTLQIRMRSIGGVTDGLTEQDFRWAVSGLPAGSFTWSPADLDDPREGAGPSPTLTIRGLFARPADYGSKTVYLYDASGEIADSTSFELFWPIFKSYQAYGTLEGETVNYTNGNFATNHPGGHAGLLFGGWVSQHQQPALAPNWFFYWRQILAELDSHRAFASRARYCNVPDANGATDANCAFPHPVGRYCVSHFSSFISDGYQHNPDGFTEPRFRIDALASTMWHEWQHVRNIIDWTRVPLGRIISADSVCSAPDWKLRPMNDAGDCLFQQATDADCDGVPEHRDGARIDDDHGLFPDYAPATAGKTESKDWSFPGPNHRGPSLKD